MSRHTPEVALKETLEDLSREDFDRFRYELLGRRKGPRFSRSRVEGKNSFQIAELLLSTFTDNRAVGETVDILRKIGCNYNAERLEEEKRGSRDDDNFVDKHRYVLLQRVRNIAPILNGLLEEGVIHQEEYDRIRASPTPQEKMRELYGGPLRAGGRRAKDIFYKLLQREEPFLVADLKEEHFVDKHRHVLIQRVTNIAPILDVLLEEGLIQQEEYDRIRASPTPQEMMRELYGGPLRAGGRRAKDIFYELLQREEPFLVADLKDDNFVDKHRHVLIQRVRNIAPILDGLLEDGVIHQEQYERIRASPTPQEMMRELYGGPLRAGGRRAKDIFYKLLQRAEPFLVAELKDEHFVDKHKHDLILRVRVIEPILDHLLAKRVIQPEEYETIRCSPTSQEKMRQVYRALQARGHRAKDVFYKVLEETEPLLVADLKGSKPLKASQKEVTTTLLKVMLLGTLEHLNYWELGSFKRYLQQAGTITGLPSIPPDRFETMENDRMVELMVETYRKQSVEVARKVLMKIYKTDEERKDLVRSLADIFKRFSEKHPSTSSQKEVTIASLKQKLLETLKLLIKKDYPKFTWYLERTDVVAGLPGIPRDDTEMAIRMDIVDLMVETYGERSVEVTREVLRKMGRGDVVQMSSGLASKEKDRLKSSQKDITRASLLETLQDLNDEELERFKWLLQDTDVVAGLPRIPRHKMEMANRMDIVDLMVETYGERSEEVTREVLRKMDRRDLEQRMADLSSGSKATPADLDTYPMMTAAKRGVCLIVSNSFFTNLQPKLRNRGETEIDEECLRKVFQWLGFEVEIHRDCTKDRMLSVFGALGRRDHSGMNCVVCCVLSHSKKGKVYGVDGLCVDFKELKEPLSELKCPSLVNKPKLFFIDACQKEMDWPTPKGTIHSDAVKSFESIRPEADFLLAMSTVPSFISYRGPETGSWFIQSLCQKLLQMVPRGVDLMSILTKVNADVSWMDAKVLEQMAQLYLTLTKKVVFPVPTGPAPSLMMDRRDLEQMMSDVSLGAKGPASSVGHEAGGSSVPDSSVWTKLDPVNSSDADEDPTYSLQSGAGSFECSVSGLRWVCKEKVSLKYQFCSSEEHMERIESMRYMPAGPLMDITVITGHLDEVYMPHWICTDSNPTISDKFAVLHIEDCGDVVEKVSEVTPTHVKLSNTDFCIRWVLLKIFGIYKWKIRCKVLIYMSKTPSLTVHLYLIPDDNGLEQKLNKKESDYGFKLIRWPNPEKALKMKDNFILTSDLERATIYPEKLMLRYKNINFFIVMTENADGNVKLHLTPENEDQPVWKCTIKNEEETGGKTAQPVSNNGASAGASGGNTTADCKHFVDKHRTALVNRVSNIEPILDGLFEKGILEPERYDDIRVLPTPQKKMRELYSGCLNAAGNAGKDVFYELLEKHEAYLFRELKAL